MLRSTLFFCAITIAWARLDSINYTSIVHTTYGPVRGEERELDGLEFKAFKGIPYAAPAVGDLRFRAPQPPRKWMTVRDATRYGPTCHQTLDHLWKVSFSPRIILRHILNIRNIIEVLHIYLNQSEDCLSLNVYTTQLGESGLKPVLVYFHGGGFVLGEGSHIVYGPEYLVEKDIVVVTMNYRLGALGFLATNTSDAPGNWGLKDQVAALKWVQDNIVNFGGDPNQVTISGASSGAASVQFHMMSPLSKGLFHKAISTSGSARCTWALNKHPDRRSRRLAKITGASPSKIKDPAKRVEFLRKLDARVLTRGMKIVMDQEDSEHGIQVEISFSPVVEPNGTERAFLVEDPKKQLSEGRFTRVPVMAGINSLEGGTLFMGLSGLKSPDDLKKFDVNVCKILPEELREPIMARNECGIVTKKILDVYFGGNSTRSSPLEFTHFFGDITVGYHTLYSHAAHARYATKDNPAYFYYFTYDGEWKLFKDLFGVKLPEVMHGDDLNYVFKPTLMKLPKLAPTSPGYRTKERMVGFMSNFVKHGNPTPSVSYLVPTLWEPATETQLNIMIIGAELSMEQNILKDRMDL